MRLSILTGTPRGDAEPVILLGPSGDVAGLRTAFKDLIRPGTNPDYAEVQLWTSDSGIVSKRKLQEPAAEAPAPDEALNTESEAEPQTPRLTFGQMMAAAKAAKAAKAEAAKAAVPQP